MLKLSFQLLFFSTFISNVWLSFKISRTICFVEIFVVHHLHSMRAFTSNLFERILNLDVSRRLEDNMIMPIRPDMSIYLPDSDDDWGNVKTNSGSQSVVVRSSFVYK